MKSYCSTSRMYHLRILSLDFNILYTFIYIMTWKKTPLLIIIKKCLWSFASPLIVEEKTCLLKLL